MVRSMGTRKQCERVATRTGARIEVLVSDPLEVQVHAPTGQHWDGRIHALLVSQDGDEPASECWQDLIGRMNDGLTACGAECEEKP